MLGKKTDTSTVNTMIGAGTQLEGTLKSTASIRVDGQLNGEIHADGNVTVGKEGKVIGNIKAQNITLEGQIEGDLHAQKHIYLVSTSKIEGDIYCESFEMEKGALFNGSSTMQDGSGQVKAKGTGKEGKARPKAEEQPTS